MPHANELLLAGRDAERDPATELFLQDHLSTCAECRDLRRKVARADTLIASEERAVVVPDRKVMAASRRPGRFAIASIAVIVVVVSAVAGTALRAFRTDDRAPQVA